MTAEVAARIGALMADSLTVWKVRGEVTFVAPGTTIIRAENGIVVSVDAASAAEHPIRWWVRWHAADTPARTKPCTSAVGLLRTVREALGAEGGYRVQIAPGLS